ncbi:MAG: phosphoribosyltransferase, partial [Acidimicrobiales bacterium]
VPTQPELAMGAIASGGAVALNDDVIRAVAVDPGALDAVIRAETGELARREALYRGPRPRPALTGANVVVVDDGLATGATMRAGVLAVRAGGAAWVLAAAPVGSAQAVRAVREVADEVVCATVPRHFDAVGLWYDEFAAVSDDEMAELLAAHRDE